MFIYNVGYHTQETFGWAQFFHEKKFTEKQFQKKVFQCMTEAYRVVNMEMDAMYKRHAEMDAKHSKRQNSKGSLDVLYAPRLLEVLQDKTFREAMIDCGFVPVEFTREIELTGWATLNDNWEDDKVTNAARTWIKKHV